MPRKINKTEKPLTLSQLIDYHNKLVEPRLEKLDKRMDSLEVTIKALQHEMNQRFDDLYKKFEALEQEYVFANAQIKRLEENSVSKTEFNEFKESVADLVNKVSVLQNKLKEIEAKF